MKKTSKQTGGIENLEKVLKFVLKIITELFSGIKTNTIAWIPCAIWFAAVNVLIYFDLEILFFNWIGINWLYLKAPEVFFVVFYLPTVFFGFILWAVRQIRIKKELSNRLTTAFLSSKLKNFAGKVPNFVGDYPVDEHTRKLVLTSESIPIDTFEAQKNHLEASLRIFIDEFKQNIETGLTSVLYSHIPMPGIFEYNAENAKYISTYTAGCTRSKIIRQSFKKSPHLLVGGQTGGGKSTLLRQIITSIYIRDKSSSFHLIDLKEGLEFQTFKDLDRINVIERMEDVTLALEKLDLELKNRMTKIKEAKCKDIDAYIKKRNEEKNELDQNKKEMKLDRKYIVIDEAAEIFLGGGGEKLENIQKIRKAISRISRLGRACGMHLIIATQRPDVKALDPQVKANLTSIISFQMPNIASSMTILGNGKAASIPTIPGRAILRSGNQLLDIHTPFLSIDEAEKLLEPFKTKQKEKTRNLEKENLPSLNKESGNSNNKKHKIKNTNLGDV